MVKSWPYVPLVLVSCLVGCEPGMHNSGPFWAEGTYQIRLRYLETPPFHPDFERRFGPFADSVVGILTIDSLAASDSAFGHYAVNLLEMGLRVGGLGALETNHTVRGAIREDGFQIEFDPDIMDNRLILNGTHSGRVAEGEWHSEGDLWKGVFTLVRR